MTTTADTLRALLDEERDKEMRAYYALCLAQLERAPVKRPEPHAPRRCWRGKMDVLPEAER
jgi:hypothetical protein